MGGRRAGVALAVVVATLALGCSGDSGPTRKDGRITKAGSLSAAELKPGDCMLAPAKVAAEVTDVRAVPCSDPHPLEAFSLVTYDKGDAYPGDKELGRYADGKCLERYADYVGIDYADSELFYTYLLPSARSWQDSKDRTIVCIVTTTGEQLTKSVQGSQR
jgi:hypothetical protein